MADVKSAPLSAPTGDSKKPILTFTPIETADDGLVYSGRKDSRSYRIILDAFEQCTHIDECVAGLICEYSARRKPRFYKAICPGIWLNSNSPKLHQFIDPVDQSLRSLPEFLEIGDVVRCYYTEAYEKNDYSEGLRMRCPYDLMCVETRGRRITSSLTEISDILVSISMTFDAFCHKPADSSELRAIFGPFTKREGGMADWFIDRYGDFMQEPSCSYINSHNDDQSLAALAFVKSLTANGGVLCTVRLNATDAEIWIHRGDSADAVIRNEKNRSGQSV